MNMKQKPVFVIVACAIAVSMVASAVAETEGKATADGKEEAYNPPTKAPVVVEKDSKIAKELLSLLSAKEGADLQFRGRITCFGRWARFGGDATQKSGEPLNDGDVAALWLYTSYGWVLVDALMDITDAGHLDSWIKDFGAPRKLFFP